MTTRPETMLSLLLPTSPYLLAYTLPLFFLSLLLTFAGAFLALDRTRVFAPRYDALKPAETTKIQHAEVVLKKVFRLEGGLGGIALGFAFGVHLTTFLALLIPNLSTSKPLSAAAFIAVWLLTGVVCSILAARWRFVTLAFAGIAGYSTLALATSVVIHPSLLTRLIFVAVFTPIGLVMCLLPIARTQHTFVRLAMASTGAFGVVHSIALLAHITSWAEVWDRLWIRDGANWGTGTEKGLSAAFCLFVMLGCASDWFLKRKLGENPDEKWDSYLADYTGTLPSASDRPGQFRPLQSFWVRYFGHNRGMDPVDKNIVFPTDADLKIPIPDSPLKLYKKRSLAGPHSDSLQNERPRRLNSPQDLLRKAGRPAVKRWQRTREVIKFDPLDPYTLSDSDDDDEFNKVVKPPIRPPTRTDSMATLTDEQPAKGPRNKNAENTLYDTEQDVTASLAHSNQWTPDFLQRHPLTRALSIPHKPPSVALSLSQSGTGSSTTLTPTAFTSVPATPSLIKAVARVTAAQQEAFAHGLVVADGFPLSPSAQSEFMPTPEERPQPRRPPQGHNWDVFWNEVKTKAGHGFHQHAPKR